MLKKLLSFYERLTFLQGMTLAITLTSALSIATVNIAGFHTFTPNTPISASQINENFEKIAALTGSGGGVNYRGVWNASTNYPDLGTSSPMPGDFYIVSATGTYNSIYYMTGQWVIFNGSNWEAANNSGAVTSVFGRTGAIATAEGDYNLDSLGDVNLSASPSGGQVLTFNGSQWVAITPATNVDWSAAGAQTINSSRLSIGAPGKVAVSDGSGLLTASTITNSELSYLSGVISPIQTQLNDKLSTISSISTPVNPTSIVNKQYVDQSIYLNGTDTILPGTGNVGIGTTSPMEKLQVDGSALINGSLRSSQWVIAPFFKLENLGTASTPNIYVQSSSTTGLFFPNPGEMAISTNGVERMRIDPTGNVGIGTTSPSYTLHVNGTSGGTSTFQVLSDIRYKKNISRVSNALEKLLQIDGVSYNFRNEEFPALKFSHHRELGVIAQKVEKVFPEAVSKDEKGFRAVAYSMLISPIIEALREVDTKTKNLEAENKMLKDYLCAKDPSAPFCE